MSWWNPIDDAKDVAKSASHLTSDAVQAGTKLCHEAYGIGKSTIKTLANIDDKALRLTAVFGEAALNAGILKPLDGVTQLAESGVKALTGYQLPKLELSVTPDTKGLGVAGKIADIAGTGVGFIAPVVLTGGLTDAVAGAALASKGIDVASETADVAASTSEAGIKVGTESGAKTETALSKYKSSNWKTAVDGAVAGFVFTPTDDKGSPFVERLKAGAIDSATFGAMGAAAKGVTRTAEAAVGAPLDSEITLKDVLDAKTSSAAALQEGTQIPLADSTKVKVAHLTGKQTGAAIAGAVTYSETSSVLAGQGFANPSKVTDMIGQYLVKSASTTSAKSLAPVLE